MKLTMSNLDIMIPLRAGDGLELSYPDQESVPVGYENLYTEKDGKYILTGVKGMKTQADIDRLQISLTKERNDHKTTKNNYSSLSHFGSIEDIVATLERVPDLEAGQGKGDPKDIDKIVLAKIAPYERQVKQLTEQITTLTGENSKFKAEKVQTTIRSAVTKAAADLKLKPGAIEDAVMHGERVLTIDETGNVVTKDGVGVTPFLDPKSWLSEVLPGKTHWVEDSFGGGSGGGGGPRDFSDNPYSHENWSVTKQMQLYKQNPTKAHQMAKKHGVDVFNPVKPVKK